jgi:hypothetical protein
MRAPTASGHFGLVSTRENLLAFAVIALVLLGTPEAFADNDIQGQPPPESAEQLITSFDQGLDGELTEETAFDEILDKSSLKLKLRNYYFARKRPDNSDPRAWAQGGSVEYKVDKVGGIFGFTAEYFGSFKLYGPDEHDGTLLLEPGQNNIDTLGIANPRATLDGNVLSTFRQRLDLPFVNAQDNRMVPITFEAYLLGMPKAENETFQYVVGYISEMKKRNEETFQSMSEGAGISDKERGMLTAGARYYLTPELPIAAIDYYVEDVWNIFYTEAIHKAKLTEDVGNTLSMQLADQRSAGDDLLRGEEFSTGFFGIQNAVSYRSVTLKLAYTRNDSGGDIRSPYGTYPGYNSSIVEDFNRAGEKSWQVGLGYNFGRLGLKGLGISLAHVHGNEAINEDSKEAISDKQENDVTIDYKFEEGTLNGLWLRARAGLVEEEGRGTTEDYRIIVNYEIPIFTPDSAAS